MASDRNFSGKNAAFYRRQLARNTLSDPTDLAAMRSEILEMKQAISSLVVAVNELQAKNAHFEKQNVELISILRDMGYDTRKLRGS